MSKEKQIEELAEVLLEIVNEKHCRISMRTLAEALISLDYCKQSDNTIELPCKVGDTVYRLKKRRGVWYILPREVVSITYRLDHLRRVEWEIFSTETDVLGKTVFLTEEEAEKVLAKIKGSK